MYYLCKKIENVLHIKAFCTKYSAHKNIPHVYAMSPLLQTHSQKIKSIFLKL